MDAPRRPFAGTAKHCILNRSFIPAFRLPLPMAAPAVNAEDISLQSALEATKGLILQDLDQYNIIGPMPLGAVTPALLPLVPLQALAPALKHFFDIIRDYSGDVNYDQLCPIMRDKAFGDLVTGAPLAVT